MTVCKVLINGQWKESTGTATFQAANPATEELLPEVYPVSPWDEIESAVQAAAQAAEEVRHWSGERFAAFLEAFAAQIETRAEEIVAAAHAETAYPISPRLKDGELPRTTEQLRQAAEAARHGSWSQPVIDTGSGIRSNYGPIGPVAVFGPNNFPLAFNSVAGGDFAAAVAAGNPVIAKGHPCHPTTTRLLAEAAHQAVLATNMPSGFVQLLYRTSHEDGAKLVSHPLLGATGYTGSQPAGLALKEAADKTGKPIYLELSSINPVFILQGALEERLDELVEEFCGSCLMGTGQFCTNPGTVVLPQSEEGQQFLQKVAEKFNTAPVGTLLGKAVLKSFGEGLITLQGAGAELVAGGSAGGGQGYCHQNTLLKVTGDHFLSHALTLQTEAFGNASLFILAEGDAQMVQIARAFEGNLTGSLYTDSEGKDDALYDQVAPVLRQKVGRLLNDKMPTGVAVVPSMNHGGPYPATGHPGFTAVGIPGSLLRFAMLQSYDNVRAHRLPALLQDKTPTGSTWRLIDGKWTQDAVQ